MSAILQLDKEGVVVERFLKFTDVNVDRSAASFALIVHKILGRCGESLQNKLIMQTYDAAAVMSGQTAGVQTLVRQKYPFAYFVHYAAHRLNLVLSQSASSIPAVTVFFANVSSFSTFTAHSSKCKDRLKSRNIEIPHPSETRWYYHSRIISIMYDKYNILLEALEDIVQNPHDWDDTALSHASGLLLHLNGFLFCFLLTVFKTIFDHSTTIFNVL